MRTVRLLLSLGLLASAPLAVPACMWDRDTLADEASGRLDVVSTIVGQFERKPRRYYEMRVTRLLVELQRPNAPAALYDDLAVALDQTGRATEAIEWMEKKTAAIASLADPAEREEQEYRRLANIGTFYAHRWIRSAERDLQTADLVVGISFIRDAIALNPNAHFGREKFQLQALEWYRRGAEKPLEITTPKDPKTSRDSNAEVTFLKRSEVRAQPDETLRGVCGIIQLGNAWENVDLMRALEAASAFAEHASLAELAKFRLDELMAKCGQSAHAHVRALALPENRDLEEMAYWFISIRGAPEDGHALLPFFRAARAVADQNAAERQRFMEARFDAGQHPDTHPAFWKGAPAARPLPPLPGNAIWGRLYRIFLKGDNFIPTLCTAAALLVLIGFYLRHKGRRERAAQAASLRYPAHP